MHGMAAASGSARMDVVAADSSVGGMFAVGDYVLWLGGTSLLVHPATRTYVGLLDQAMKMMYDLPPEIVAQMSISGIAGTAEKISGNQPINGRPTEHHRTTISFVMNTMGQSTPTKVTTDVWIAKLPVKFTNPLAGGARPRVTSGFMAELAKKQIELTLPMTDGVAVKTVIATSQTFTTGQSTVSTVTTEMKNTKDAAVDAALFAIPAGYTKVDK
jgi:hypothetical protein